MECYVFATEESASSALKFINGDAMFPLVGNNAKTGELAPYAQKTIKWSELSQRVDGKFFFPRLPLERIAQRTSSEIEYFSTTFPHEIENFSEDWLPADLPVV